MKARLTIKQLDEWRGESEHVDLLLEYIGNLHRQIERLIHLGDVTEDEDGLFFGEIVTLDTKAERNIKLSALLIVASSGLLNKDGILMHK